ncbi:hypothetical protein SUGI_0680730 [Cryptomeria japonica]|nr:hypothetical protein SUGI_0680730 [Cryptomeria japonica]
MEMEIGIWQSIPDEIALIIVARLLPRRSLVRLRTVWKEWNDMLSSYAAMRRIYPNIHLSYTSAFLFQCFDRNTGAAHTWVMEGSGDFYKISDDSYRIEIACNTSIVFNHFGLVVCEEKSRGTSKRVNYFYMSDRYFGIAFDSSSDQFIIMMGSNSGLIRLYYSSSDSWSTMDVNDFQFLISGRGVYHRGRFYWLDEVSCKGGVVEYNHSDFRFTKIPPPHDAMYRYSGSTFKNSPYMYWALAGSDVGQLILVDREYGFMWKLQNGEDNINSNRWCRVDIWFPREIMLISVNNNGWIAMVDREGINVYDGNRRLVRKFVLDEVDPEIASAINKLKSPPINDDYLLSVLPFECTYIWWPCGKNILN